MKTTNLIVLVAIFACFGCEGTVDAGIDEANTNNVNNANNANNQNNLNNANNANNDVDMGSDDVGIECPSVACGEELFRFNCESCHGPGATGTPVVFPGSIAGFDDIAPLVTNGRRDMLPIPLPPEDIASIQLYIDSLANADETTWSGEEVYARKCAGCHGAAGEGVPDPDNPSWMKRGYHVQQPIDGYFEWITRNGVQRLEYTFEMPAYPEITDQQFAEMKAFLRPAVTDRSGQNLYNTYCANCHGLSADGGAIMQGLLWVKMFGANAMTNDTRMGFFVTEFGNPDFMAAYDTTFFTDAEIQAMTTYIQNNL